MNSEQQTQKGDDMKTRAKRLSKDERIERTLTILDWIADDQYTGRRDERGLSVWIKKATHFAKPFGVNQLQRDENGAAQSWLEYYGLTASQFRSGLKDLEAIGRFSFGRRGMGVFFTEAEAQEMADAATQRKNDAARADMLAKDLRDVGFSGADSLGDKVQISLSPDAAEALVNFFIRNDYQNEA